MPSFDESRLTFGETLAAERVVFNATSVKSIVVSRPRFSHHADVVSGAVTADVHLGERVFLMAVRGIRGATNVAVDDKSEVLAATRELLVEVLRANDLDVHFDDIVSAIFTTTRDLESAFPAEAARALGMAQVPLLCASEIPVPDSLPRCIRVLLHVNTDKTQAEMVHVYLRDAKKLRPDMSSAQ